MIKIPAGILGVMALMAPVALALDNGMARTPPMGWNPWNSGGRNITEGRIKAVADAFVTSGMKDAGYTWVNLDDYWFEQEGHKRSSVPGEAVMPRDGRGMLLHNPKKFPNGIKPVADYVKSKGLRFGMYLRPAETAGHEYKDFRLMADWGMEFLKLDMPPAYLYPRMRDALLKIKPSVLYSIHHGVCYPDTYELANMWRTSGDINVKWDSILGCFYTVVGREAFAGPGAWNDPDMLEVGNGQLTLDENKAHFSLWCMAAAPLVAGNDVTRMSPNITAILTNRELIAVNQDALGIQGYIVKREGDGEVWTKPLSNGDRAVLLFNKHASEPREIEITWNELGWRRGAVKGRDLWLKKDLGMLTDGFKASVPPHGVVVVRLSGGVNAPATAASLVEHELSYPSKWWGPPDDPKTWKRRGSDNRYPLKDTAPNNLPLQVGDRHFKRGLTVPFIAGYPSGFLAWRLDGKYKEIKLNFGVLKYSGASQKSGEKPGPQPSSATVTFEFHADLQLLHKSQPLMENSPAASITLDVSGKHTVFVRVTRSDAKCEDFWPILGDPELVPAEAAR